MQLPFVHIIFKKLGKTPNTFYRKSLVFYAPFVSTPVALASSPLAEFLAPKSGPLSYLRKQNIPIRTE